MEPECPRWAKTALAAPKRHFRSTPMNGRHHLGRVGPLRADTVEKVENRIVSKISRKLIHSCLDRCTPLSADTKVGGRFCVKRCGPSRRRVRNASAVLRNFVHHPKRTFSTLSTTNGHCTFRTIWDSTTLIWPARRSISLWQSPGNQQSSRQRLPTMLPQTTSTTVHWPFGSDMDSEPSNSSGSSQDR